MNERQGSIRGVDSKEWWLSRKRRRRRVGLVNTACRFILVLKLLRSASPFIKQASFTDTLFMYIHFETSIYFIIVRNNLKGKK